MITRRNTRKRTRKPGQPGGKPPTSLGEGSQGEHVRSAAGRAALLEPPLQARGPARFSVSVHSFRTRDCRSPALQPRTRRELRGRVAGPGHNPRPESRPRRSSRPRVNRTCRGPHRPRARLQARSPALYRAAARPPLPRPHRPGVPVSGVQRRPEVSPAPPPQRPTSSPPRPDLSPRCLGPLRGCRGKQMAARPGSLKEESKARGPKPA